MSLSVARRKRTALYLSAVGLLLAAAALSAISARDPDGVALRVGMTLVTLGAAVWLPWQALLPAVVAVWLGPNIGRNMIEGYELFNVNMMLELPGLIGLAVVASIARAALGGLEKESILLGMNNESFGLDPVTGVFEESQLRSSLEMELSRSRRFNRTFSLVLVAIDEMRQRFDYRTQDVWQASFATTANLLLGTRTNVDRVYRYGATGFALILPESGEQEVVGLVRRLRREARNATPKQGEPGGPLPAHYGATFFPSCATTVDDLIRRAEVMLRISDNTSTRIQMDSAAAPELPPAEMLRQHVLEADVEKLPQKPAAEAVSIPVAPLRLVPPATALELQLRHEPSNETSEVIESPLEASLVEDSAPRAQLPMPALLAVEDLDAADDVASEMPHAGSTAPAEVEDFPFEAGEPLGASALPDAIEVDEGPPFELFAFRAPEPAVDVLSVYWHAEAPLSVVRKPQPVLRPKRMNAVAEERVDMNDTLKQLDTTLKLIRSLKRRSA